MKLFASLFEIFGIRPSFNCNGHSSFPSTYDYVISTIYTLIVLVIVIYKLVEVGNHKSATFTTTIYNEETPGKIYLDNENFFFALGIQDENYVNWINESIYTIEAKFIINKSGKNLSSYPLEVTTCDKVIHPKNTNFMDRIPISNLYCIKSLSNLSLEGTFGASTWSYINFYIKKCNKKINSNCSDQEFIKKKLLGGYVGLFYLEYFINLDDYKNPARLVGKNDFSSISSSFYKEYWIYMKNIYIRSYETFIFNRIHTIDNLFSVDKRIEHIDFRDADDVFLNLYIRLGENKYVYTRSYKGLISIITEIWGFIFTLYYIFKVISFYFEGLLYKSFIISFFDNNLCERLKELNNLNLKNSFDNKHDYSLNTLKMNNFKGHIHNSFMKNENEDKKYSCSNIRHKYLSLLNCVNQNNKNNIPNNNLANKFSSNSNNNLSNNNNNINNVSNSNNTIINSDQRKINKNLIKISSENLFKKNFSHRDPSNPDNDIKIFKNANLSNQKNAIQEEESKDKIFRGHPDNNINYLINNTGNNNGLLMADNGLCNEGINGSIKFKNTNSSPTIKPFNCKDILKLHRCNIDTISNARDIRKIYNNISIYFDVIRFLKLYNDQLLIKNLFLTKNQYVSIENDFSFNKNSFITSKFFHNKNNLYNSNERSRLLQYVNY